MCIDIILAYDFQVCQIIEEVCFYVGCYLDGFVLGVYIFYEGLFNNIESGVFCICVFEL